MKDIVSDYLKVEVSKAEAMLKEVRDGSVLDSGGVVATAVKSRINVIKNMLENRETDLKGGSANPDLERRYRIKDNLNGDVWEDKVFDTWEAAQDYCDEMNRVAVENAEKQGRDPVLWEPVSVQTQAR